MKKIVLLISALLIFTISLTGCSAGKGDNKSAGNSQTNTSDNLLSKIKKDGVIKIGTEGTYSPFTFHDKDGKLTGFDVEIAEEVAKRLGVKAEFIETKWDGMFAGLDAKRFDIVVNEVGIQPDRQQKYDFSDPYIVTKAVVIVGKDNQDVKKFEDLKGKKTAQTLTSNYAKLAKSYGAEVVQDEGFNQSIDLILSKRADATINDNISFLDLKKQKPDIPVKVAAEQSDAASNAILFRKGNKELVDAVNKALGDIKSDGTFLKISNKWFNQDVSK